MLKLSLGLSVAEEEKLRTKAQSLGLSLAGYVSHVVRDALRKESDPFATKILRAIRGIVPVFVEVLGHTQEVTQEEIEKLTKKLLDRYDREL